ncbi:UNVERIFIED_CONTAM: hypothetical protein PYX00_001313 [Menopon gallinae]|uniref:Uncharacterized protein n=1 Tax=Menopon gallinae TaxID=328185 RepID=A0AAW2IBU5_9NEOP
MVHSSGNSDVNVVVSFRRELDKIRGAPKQSLNEQKNDHLTVQWLSTAVGELRAELAELSATCNSSAELQQTQEISSGLDLLRGDVASFRRDLEELRAEQQQTVVTLGQLKQDVESSIENGQKAMAMAVSAKSEVSPFSSYYYIYYFSIYYHIFSST